MQRLFSNFADGWPGAGLLLLRLLSGGLLSGAILSAWPVRGLGMVPLLLAAGGGTLLLLGLYTPLAGILAAFAGAWIALSHHCDLSVCLGLVGLSLSLAMIGPGAWSIDARLFGRKQIDPSEFESDSDRARKL